MISERSVYLFLRRIYKAIGIEPPSNHKDILQFIIDYLEENTNDNEWNGRDVNLAFRKFLETKS